MISSLRVLVVAALVTAGASSCDSNVHEMTFPVAGKVTYSDTFGAPRSGGRTHEGQDLLGSKGTVLVAAADGTVSSLRYSSTGLSGNSIYITDADGWTYMYMHVNNDRPGTDDGANVYEQAFFDGIRKGQKVKAGEPIAYMGDSGNAESTVPHLHFELHDPDGNVVNSYGSLKAATKTVLTKDDMHDFAPFGWVDSISGASKSVSAKGWAIDRGTDAPVNVSVLVDGNPVATSLANKVRNDVAAAYPPSSPNHGFSIVASSIAVGRHKVCVIFHNAGDGGGSLRARCETVSVT